MFRKLSFIAVCTSATLLAGGSSIAAENAGNAAETKLRESLRNTMLQLRAAETERDTLKAAQDQVEADKKTAEENLAKVTKQSIADKETSDKKIAELDAQVADKNGKITQLGGDLEKWKTAYNQVADIARAKEGERAKLAGEKIVLERKVADRETKNMALYKLGNEILSRYEKFGLGTALTSREPFTGITKVKLENLVQDYGDKLAEQKIKPGEEPSTPAPASQPAAPGDNTKPAPAQQKGKADAAAKTKSASGQKAKPASS